MSLDVAGLLAAAAGDPRFAAALQPIVKAAVRDALSESAADSWLDTAGAALHVYGCEGQEEAFRKLRARHPELDRFSVGEHKLRRWKRGDLDAWLASNPRAQRRQERGEHAPKK